MGTLEDVQEQDHDTQVALHLVREAAKDEAFHSSLDTAVALRRAITHALGEINDEVKMLGRVKETLNKMDLDIRITGTERERQARVPAPIGFAPTSAGVHAYGAPPEREPISESRRIFGHSGPERPGMYVPPEAMGRYRAPPPPSDERFEEWRRKHQSR